MRFDLFCNDNSFIIYRANQLITFIRKYHTNLSCIFKFLQNSCNSSNVYYEFLYLYWFLFFNWLQKYMIHIGPNHFGCPYCPKEMKDSSNMKRHIMIHTGVKPFSCHFCEYTSVRKDYMDKHIPTHSTHFIK